MDSISEIITLNVNGKDYSLDLADVAARMRIDPAHLDEELEGQAAFYFWVSNLATEAILLAEEAKHLFEIAYSEMLKEVRTDYASKQTFDDKGKPLGKIPAQDFLEAEVKTSPEYKERLGEYLEVHRIAEILKTVKEAVYSRQFTLIERSKRLAKDEAFERFMEGQQ